MESSSDEEIAVSPPTMGGAGVISIGIVLNDSDDETSQTNEQTTVDERDIESGMSVQPEHDSLNDISEDKSLKKKKKKKKKSKSKKTSKSSEGEKKEGEKNIKKLKKDGSLRKVKKKKQEADDSDALLKKKKEAADPNVVLISVHDVYKDASQSNHSERLDTTQPSTTNDEGMAEDVAFVYGRPSVGPLVDETDEEDSRVESNTYQASDAVSSLTLTAIDEDSKTALETEISEMKGTPTRKKQIYRSSSRRKRGVSDGHSSLGSVSEPSSMERHQTAATIDTAATPGAFFCPGIDASDEDLEDPYEDDNRSCGTIEAESGVLLNAGVGPVAQINSLAVAEAVNEEHEDEPDVVVTSALEHSPEPKPRRFGDRRKLMYILAALLVISIGAIAATLGVVLSNREDDGVSDKSALLLKEVQFREKLKLVVGEDKLDDADSPHSKALEWIVRDDPAMLGVEDNRLVQRFILAYFYFATTTEKPWRSCNPPILENGETNICQLVRLFRPRHNLELFEEPFDTLSQNRWLTSVDECFWAGITCDEQRNVTVIHLDGQQFTGEFPDDVLLLPSLNQLRIGVGELKGKLPPLQDHHLERFVAIDVRSNEFTGSIPDSWWGAHNLDSLNVADNALTGTMPPAIGDLRKLTKLHLERNQFAGELPTEIGLLTNLDVFYFYINNFEGPLGDEIGNLGNLDSLAFHNNLLSGTLPTTFGKLSSVGVLVARNNPRLGGDLPTELWKMTALQGLYLDNCNFTGTIDPRIGDLPFLKTFHINHNSLITGSVPRALAMPKLSELHIEGTQLTGRIPPEICAYTQTTPGSSELLEVSADCAPDSSGFVELECEAGCCFKCCGPNGDNCVEYV